MAKRTYPHVCTGCSRRFTSGSPMSAWCSPTCRTRVKRAEAREGRAEAESAERAAEPKHPLVIQARAELTEAEKLSTVDGVLVMELAEAIAKCGPSGKVGLVREFQRARATVLGREVEVPAEESDGDESALPTPEDRQVDEVRRKRDEKRASLAAG